MKKSALLFSDINPYHTSCECKNVDGQKHRWLPYTGRLNKLKIWWSKLSQESIGIICGTKKVNTDSFFFMT